MNVLLLNAGSSSLKATLADAGNGRVVATGAADWAGTITHYEFESANGKHPTEQVSWSGHAQAVGRFLQDLRLTGLAAVATESGIAAVGHRVVHGGSFTSSVIITPQIRAKIAALADLAPLHNPPSLETLAVAEVELPDVPHVAVFDTAFHASLPPQAYTYPVPQSWTRNWGIRRFGFHGLSHAYCSQRAAEMLGHSVEESRLVICHLGHGCSAAAVAHGRSIDTTMGFTPLEGLMMATRSGSLDPGILLHIQQHHGLSAEQIEMALNRECGLLGVSGISGDMRRVLTAAQEGNEQARLALAIYAHRVRQAIGALAVTMGGCDALIFTAGVGEHAAEIRRDICTGLECLGLRLDPAANEVCKPDADVASDRSQGRILVIRTREDIAMLREVIQAVDHDVEDA